MGLMIFGQKFDLGNCFIVLSNCRKSENGYYGAIFSYQLSYNNNYVALRSCNMLQMKSVPNFVNEPNPIIIPTIRPFFNEALNGLYTYYTNWAVGIGGGGNEVVNCVLIRLSVFLERLDRFPKMDSFLK